MAGNEIQIVHFGNANFPPFELKRKYWNTLIMSSIRGKALTLEHKISIYFVSLNIEHIKFDLFLSVSAPERYAVWNQDLMNYRIIEAETMSFLLVITKHVYNL